MELHFRTSGGMPPSVPELRMELWQHLIRTRLAQNVISERVPHVVGKAEVPQRMDWLRTSCGWVTQQANVREREWVKACGVGYNLGLNLLIGQQD